MQPKTASKPKGLSSAEVAKVAELVNYQEGAGNDQGVTPDVVMACCGDVPTLETLAAVSIMREQLPYLRIRVVNVVVS